MSDNPIDVANADLLLTTTRAVRKRLDLTRPVEPEIVLDCLQIAVQAPTASNAQGWRWMVVTDPAKRAALADMYSRQGVRTSKRVRRASSTTTRSGCACTSRRSTSSTSSPKSRCT